MSRAILLDSGPLGMVTNPKAKPPYLECQLWLDALLQNGETIVLPEIADYEVRRELMRAKKLKGIAKLDRLKGVLAYRPITTPLLSTSPEFWAQARQSGKPTADAKALDGDVILAAQAWEVGREGYEAIVATTNVGHLSRFVDAREWRQVR